MNPRDEDRARGRSSGRHVSRNRSSTRDESYDQPKNWTNSGRTTMRQRSQSGTHVQSYVNSGRTTMRRRNSRERPPSKSKRQDKSKNRRHSHCSRRRERRVDPRFKDQQRTTPPAGQLRRWPRMTLNEDSQKEQSSRESSSRYSPREDNFNMDSTRSTQQGHCFTMNHCVFDAHTGTKRVGACRQLPQRVSREPDSSERSKTKSIIRSTMESARADLTSDRNKTFRIHLNKDQVRNVAKLHEKNKQASALLHLPGKQIFPASKRDREQTLYCNSCGSH
ncbi:hypothetical protein L596_027873 [Steinernema carpocapsae]|uniref:Uncharacterized protein n=1 Tax=Steinernema carpocapsae TaxID=34508 RepID=A0A4U5LWU0_STECR|nr:hypothetical protein L596_027873 [Steinernema carpocapsae]